MELIERLSEFISSSSQVLGVDPAGRATEPQHSVPEAPATLFVRKPTDALKAISSGSIVGSVDREAVWEVLGYAISRQVASALISMETPPTDLLVDVPAIGFAWDVIEMGDDLSLPNT